MELVSQLEPARDRRVRRSRAALMEAAIALVTERGTAAVALSDIATAADVSRKVAYQQFGDRDTLLLEAALDLIRRELVPRLDAAPPGRQRSLESANHFAKHRALYRALFTSSKGLMLSSGLADLVLPTTRQRIAALYGGALDAQVVDDLATHTGGGTTAMLVAWLTDGGESLDPESFTDRLLRVHAMTSPAAVVPAEVAVDRPVP